MKINYPVKYALMPIIEQVGWTHGLHELERDYDVVYYVVSKCYLINDTTKYKEDGSIEREYEVVFPYQPSEFNSWKREKPSYNLMHGGCINSNKVDRIFDTYEEALKCAKGKNESLCEKTWVSLPITDDILDKIEEKKSEFNSKAEEYLALQELISLNTLDMEVKENKELDYVIEVSKNGTRVLKCNIYEIIRLFSSDSFAVYNISKKDYDRITKNGNIEEIKDCTKKGIVLHKDKNDAIILATGEDIGAYYIENNGMGYDQKLDRVDHTSFSSLNEDTLTFYTSETLIDLIKSYKKYPVITREQVKEKVIKK